MRGRASRRWRRMRPSPRDCSRRSSRRSRAAAGSTHSRAPRCRRPPRRPGRSFGAASQAGGHLELDQDAGNRELADDRGPGRAGRREIGAPDRVPGREVARVGEKALDAEHLRAFAPAAASTASMSSSTRWACAPNAAGDHRERRRDRRPRGRTGAAGRRTGRRRRSPARLRPSSTLARPRCDELVCSPVQPSTVAEALPWLLRGSELRRRRVRLHYPVQMLESDSKLALSPAPRRKLSETVADAAACRRAGSAAGHEGPVGARADEGSRRGPFDGARGSQRPGDARHRRDPPRPGRVRHAANRHRAASRRPSPPRSSAESRTSSSRRA